MAVFKANKVATMPGTPDADALYFVKAGGDTKFKLKATNSSGTPIDLDAITTSDLTTALATKADDSAVVHKSGTETITGVKTFSVSPGVPAPTSGGDATNKTYVDAADSSLQTQINNLNTSIAEGLRVPTDIDCSSNPNYPSATKGDGFKVSVAGKIGGASGVDVEVGDTIYCKTTSAGGTHASVGANFFIIQTNLNDATTTVKGFSRLATQAEAQAGSNATAVLTPSTGMDIINSNAVKFSASQSLTSPQKSQARTNIGAADDSNVVHLTGAESISGVKTFSSSPVVPTLGQGDNSTKAASTAYVDAGLAAVSGSATVNWNAGAAVGW